jgi:hypothetical protein
MNKESISAIANDGVALTAAVCSTVLMYKACKQREALPDLPSLDIEEV